MISKTWSSNNRKYSVNITSTVLDQINQVCLESRHYETGGILIGRYSSDLYEAIITEATPPPEDSKKGPSWFLRGIKGLGELLRDRWRNRQRTYYIGEWHYHPATKIIPSPDDVREIKSISISPHYQCVAPIMLIVGKFNQGQRPARMFIYKEAKKDSELFPI